MTTSPINSLLQLSSMSRDNGSFVIELNRRSDNGKAFSKTKNYDKSLL